MPELVENSREVSPDGRSVEMPDRVGKDIVFNLRESMIVLFNKCINPMFEDSGVPMKLY